jgi:dihydrofolate reductase
MPDDAMIEVVYYAASSLDGYIATANGSVDWLSSFHREREDYGAAELHASVDALLLGSYTYEFALKLGRWPAPDKPSWVFTHRDLRVLHPSITLTSENPAEVLAVLAERGFRRAGVLGGGKLATSFQAERLISRYIVTVVPLLLGSGIPLFDAQSSPPNALRFVAAKPFNSGVVQLTYDRVDKA